jgi:glycosyltransferase involved in cell wall biosynthesis
MEQLALKPGQVILAGPIESEDVAVLYSLAKLFVFPSLYEGFGLPAAEALAAGTPVLVSDVSSLVEVVRDRRCRFDPNSDELTAKLVAAARDPSPFCLPLPVEFTSKYFAEQYELILRSLFRG